MPRAVAINVGANTNLPGFRAPVFPDGRFEYVPIPEREPTREPVPTYADLDLSTDVPDDHLETPVHLDPEFAGVHGSEAYTYGDEHAVKAGPLSSLTRGDFLLFYATLSRRDDAPADWGAFLVGEFRVARVVSGEEYEDLDPAAKEAFSSNAHVERDPFDARVLVAGDDDSRLFDRAVPLSEPGAGADANRLVTSLSNDSGKGPWWRRPLRFDAEATASLRERIREKQDS
ncbi:hypothetical protein ACFQJD_14595 [Haloplanus sp. GCM10025708]|uniref:Nmad3 family putative nucleotide modification protein n=1 Tax=Haloferacaceae TaxID=1644056 RepID=UPI00361EAA16